MHRTLKLEATHPSRNNLLQQQETFDEFRQQFNFERPHQALDMKCPAKIYQQSPRPYQGLPDLAYPGADKTVMISNCGKISISRNTKISISRAFANQPVGLIQVDSGIWQVDFMSYTLG
ncbi:MAG: hypothetical protein ACKODS_04930, partial [Methylophilaceae bacterium]